MYRYFLETQRQRFIILPVYTKRYSFQVIPGQGKWRGGGGENRVGQILSSRKNRLRIAQRNVCEACPNSLEIYCKFFPTIYTSVTKYRVYLEMYGRIKESRIRSKNVRFISGSVSFPLIWSCRPTDNLMTRTLFLLHYQKTIRNAG